MNFRGVLASVPLFAKTLAADELDRLAANVRSVEFARGAVLMRERDLGRSMYVLTGGKVAVSVHSRGGDREVATLAAGDIVGEMSLLTGERRSATVTALRAVTACEIDRPALEPIISGRRDLMARFADVIEQRNAELVRVRSDTGRWNSVGVGLPELVARMTAYYAG
jgi:CRP/FNR family transcriptional regulator, cyclic AMP receptor protein